MVCLWSHASHPASEPSQFATALGRDHSLQLHCWLVSFSKLTSFLVSKIICKVDQSCMDFIIFYNMLYDFIQNPLIKGQILGNHVEILVVDGGWTGIPWSIMKLFAHRFYQLGLVFPSRILPSLNSSNYLKNISTVHCNVWNLILLICSDHTRSYIVFKFKSHRASMQLLQSSIVLRFVDPQEIVGRHCGPWPLHHSPQENCGALPSWWLLKILKPHITMFPQPRIVIKSYLNVKEVSNIHQYPTASNTTTL